MVLDTAAGRGGGTDRFNAMRIAHHALFTAREKLDLLHRIRTETTAGDDRSPGFSADEIDAAIEEVKLGAQSGQGAGPKRSGDH